MKKQLSRPSVVHKEHTSSAISSTATDAVRKSEEERPPMPTSTAASSLPIRMVAEYEVSTTSSTIITFDNNRVTILEPAVNSEAAFIFVMVLNLVPLKCIAFFSPRCLLSNQVYKYTALQSCIGLCDRFQSCCCCIIHFESAQNVPSMPTSSSF